MKKKIPVVPTALLSAAAPAPGRQHRREAPGQPSPTSVKTIPLL